MHGNKPFCTFQKTKGTLERRRKVVHRMSKKRACKRRYCVHFRWLVILKRKLNCIAKTHLSRNPSKSRIHCLPKNAFK